MKVVTPHSVSPFNLAACQEVMRQLAAWQIPVMLLDADGKPMPEGQPSPSLLCPDCPACRSFLSTGNLTDDLIAKGLEQGGSADTLGDGPVLLGGLCPQQTRLLLVPVSEDGEQTALLAICLRELASPKTGELQRICDRYGLDNEVVYRQTLQKTLAVDRTASLLTVMIQQLIKRSLAFNQQGNDIELLSHSLVQCYEELSLLHRMTDNMRLNKELGAFFAQLICHLCEVMESGEMMIFWNQHENSCRTLDDPLLMASLPQIATSGKIAFADHQIKCLWDRATELFDSGKPFLIDGSVDGPVRYRWPEPIRNVIMMPIRLESKIYGLLMSVNKMSKPDFDSIDIKLMDLVASELAVFLENRRLYDDMHDLLLGSLGALTSSIDAKDPYTCGHSQRVARISRLIAERVGLDSKLTNTIYLAGLLHDIGKIGVSESVLCKPGKLTGEEFEQIKKHPQIGANILREIKQMAEVRETVLSHHERYDGKGYPRGLSGREIPLSGRIVMLADSFDAMTSNRHYRNALPLNMVLAEIRRFSGTQFDPELAEIILQPDMYDILSEFRLTAAAQ